MLQIWKKLKIQGAERKKKYKEKLCHPFFSPVIPFFRKNLNKTVKSIFLMQESNQLVK